MVSDSPRYKSLPKLAGYAPTCEHSLEGREGLVYHFGSVVFGALVTALVQSWASVLLASSLERG